MVTRSRLAAFIVLLSAVVSSIAQDRSTADKTASIRGMVIDSKTGQPLNGASITLHNMQVGGEWNSVSTAADGRFSFTGLVAGRYGLSASHNGYLDAANTRGRSRGDQATRMTVSVGAGQELDDVVLRLTPSSVIAGRITNERNEPMAGVYVQTMKASYRNGHREFSDARAGFTDDRGEYRIWGLAPGNYYVKATNPRTWGKASAVREIYVPTFYPSVIDPSQSQAIEVRPGDEVGGINLALSPSRTVRVKGRILTANSGPAKGAQVTFSQASGSGYSVQGEADAAGKFEIPAVVPGSYVMEAELRENGESGRSLMARTTVQVSENSGDNFDLVLFPGSTVSGRVRVEGERKLSMGRASASLKPLESSDSASNVGSAVVQADGTFVFHDVPEGRYRIRLSPLPDGYYVRGGGDADTGVLVSRGHASPVEVRLAPGAGRIQGVIYKDKDSEETAAFAAVVLVPDGKRRSDSEYYREAAADQSGKFVLGSIPPGDYLLFAWQEIEKDAYMDPYFIQQYESAGKSVRVEEGNNLSLQLQLAAPARD